MSKEKKPFGKSLGSLLHFMEGMEVIVELKTGKRHRGILTSADNFMNLTIEKVDAPRTLEANASSCDTQDNGDYFPDIDITCSMDIRGPSIRYIQFPDNVNVSTVVRSGVERERIASNKYKRGKRKA
eukprot:Nitzschia sp. Nitz4//scaffold28_size193895//19993//20373//NITZ4_001624-RA/size193895-processed-gene-0.4-mRNA-1//1//CDS//3329545859//5574//frame0